MATYIGNGQITLCELGICVNANSWLGEFHSTSTLEDACNADARIIEVGQSVVVRLNNAC